MMSLEQWESCFPLLKLTLESSSFTTMLYRVTVMWLTRIKLMSSLWLPFRYITHTYNMYVRVPIPRKTIGQLHAQHCNCF
jgi:hypothetical protein